MFYGEYRHNLDVKGRLILPSRFRDIYKENAIENFYLTRGLDKCVFMFAESEWRVQEKKFREMSFTKKETRRFNRVFFSGAASITPDKQGRFIIPSYLKEYAEINKSAVIIGVSNRIEIWDTNAWQSFYDDSKESFEEIAENILEL